MPTPKLLAAGLTLAIVMAASRGTAVENGKGSCTVVKTSVRASKIDAAGKQMVLITLMVDKGWHIYANPVNHRDFASSQTLVSINGPYRPVVRIQYPAGKEHVDNLGRYWVYEDTVNIQAEVTRSRGDTGPLEVQVRFNACNAQRRVCLPEGTEKFTIRD